MALEAARTKELLAQKRIDRNRKSYKETANRRPQGSKFTSNHIRLENTQKFRFGATTQTSRNKKIKLSRKSSINKKIQERNGALNQTASNFHSVGLEGSLEYFT